MNPTADPSASPTPSPTSAAVSASPTQQPVELRGFVFEDSNGDGELDGSEQGTPGVTVLRTSPRRRQQHSAVTDSDGVYRFLLPPTADFRYEPISNATVSLVELPAYQLPSWALVFPAVLGGVVRSAEGLPVGGVQVTAAFDGATLLTETAPDGSFSFQVPPGRWELAFNGATRGVWLLESSAAVTPQSDANLQFDLTTVTVLQGQTSTIEGSAVTRVVVQADSALLVGPNATLDVVAASSLSGTSISAAGGSSVFVTVPSDQASFDGSLQLSQGASVVFSTGNSSSSSSSRVLDFSGSTVSVSSGSVLVLQGSVNATSSRFNVGGDVVVAGDFTVGEGTLSVQDGGLLQVNGTLQLEGSRLEVVLVEPLKPCDSRTITIAQQSAAFQGAPPAVALGGGSVFAGVASIPSYSGNTLSVTLSSDGGSSADTLKDGSAKCYVGVSQTSVLTERHPYMVPLLALLGIGVFCILFAILVQKSYERELRTIEKRDAQRKHEEGPHGPRQDATRLGATGPRHPTDALRQNSHRSRRCRCARGCRRRGGA